jgi:diguanylate cyclase (GGDEF)-like protein/PAS domain S-box-containing protein
MNKAIRIRDYKELNHVLSKINAFMLEQSGINDFDQLVKTIVDQLDELVSPIATLFSEYDSNCKLLRAKETKASEKVMNEVLKIGGKNFFSTVTPINEYMYKLMNDNRVTVFSSMHEATDGSIPTAVSKALDKLLGVTCYLRLAFVLDGQLYSTAAMALNEVPDQHVIELLSTYTNFSSASIKRVVTEQALRKSEQELKTITENMNDLIAMTDTEGRFTYLSNNHYNLFGYHANELLGRHAWEILFTADLDKMVETFTNKILAGEDGLAEYRVVCKDGSLLWVECNGSILYDDALVSGALLISRDISERKKAEEAIKESEAELKTVTENMTDLVSMINDEGVITYVSGSYLKLLGYKREEILGKTIYDLVHSDYLPYVYDKVQKGIAEGKNDTAVYRAVKKDGSTIWLETVSNLILDDSGQIFKGAIFSTRDISERKKAEEEIKKARDQYQSLVNNIPGIAFRCNLDQERTMLYVSDDVVPITGYPSIDFIENSRRSYASVIFKDDTNLIQKSIQQAVKNKLAWNIDYRVVHRDGSLRWVNEKARAVYDHNNRVQFIEGLILDITEQKELDNRIKHLSFHDQLTNFYNRNYFEVCQAELKESPLLSVIMTDINGLKLINDTYGHQAGDELLKNYAELLKKSFKQNDLFFRWGGDEFVVILKNTVEAKSWDLCNRLIKHCGDYLVKDIPLSISVGISSKLRGGDINKAIQEAEDMMYKNKLNESKSSKNLIMKTLLQTLAEKSFETKEHIDRMTIIGRQFGNRLLLPLSELNRLETLIMLHDIGKINIDGHILLKKTALSDEEWAEIRKHPEVGYRITCTAEEFTYVAEEIFAHHERWDGKGYPRGLAGDDIPYLARILSLIDSYDVMCNGRPYKVKMSREEIIEEVVSCSGKHFDPNLAEEFVTFLKEGFY